MKDPPPLRHSQRLLEFGEPKVILLSAKVAHTPGFLSLFLCGFSLSLSLSVHPLLYPICSASHAAGQEHPTLVTAPAMAASQASPAVNCVAALAQERGISRPGRGCGNGTCVARRGGTRWLQCPNDSLCSRWVPLNEQFFFFSWGSSK